MGRAYAGVALPPAYFPLWLGQLLSAFGDTLHSVALVVLVYRLTGEGGAGAPLVAAEVVPVLLLAPVAGVVIDRFDREGVLVASDVARAVLALSLALWLWLWLWRSGVSRSRAAAFLRESGVDLVRMPGRLRRLAGDPRAPRRARWWLIGLAIYIASPIDPIPDVIPIIGFVDEAVLVPIVLIRVKRMIPPEVWAECFPARPAFEDATVDAPQDAPGPPDIGR